MTPKQLLAEFEASKLDLLKSFSAGCRKELLEISSAA
jgi:hypothetical protein